MSHQMIYLHAMDIGNNSPFVFPVHTRSVSPSAGRNLGEWNTHRILGCYVTDWTLPWIPTTGAAPREGRLIVLRAIKVLRAKIELYIIVPMLRYKDQGRFQFAVHREWIYGASLRGIVIADLVAADVPDCHFCGEIVRVALAIFPLVDMDVTFADHWPRPSFQCVRGHWRRGC